MIFKKNKYTLKQKQKIVNKIYDNSEEDVLDDFKKLVEIGCNKHAKLSHVGSKVVNKFTAVERLNTVYNLYRKNKICFYDVIHNKQTLKHEKRIKQMLKFYKQSYSNYPETKMWFRISNLYYNAISIFNPLIAMDVYCKFKPTCVLDFTMGWGGRLVGACALNIPKYIGIDNNTNLVRPYDQMTTFLKKHSTTQIELHFKDALLVDYSKLEYDLVLTSPPYYNIELYSATKEQSNEEWDNKFYIPIFKTTFEHLKKGGYYCLNIPSDVYEQVALKTLGKPSMKIPLPKAKRYGGTLKGEFIYVWAK
jgi:hypothetical protein